MRGPEIHQQKEVHFPFLPVYIFYYIDVTSVPRWDSVGDFWEAFLVRSRWQNGPVL